jgi:hypothetical protein
MEETKKCIGCNETLPIIEFNVNSLKTRHLNPRCKKCLKIYNQKRYQEKKDKILAQNKEWRDNNKEYRHKHDKEYRNKPEIKERNKQQQKERYENPESIIIRREYREKHKDEKREYDKIYCEKNKNKIKERLIKNKDINKVKSLIYFRKNKEKIYIKKKERYVKKNKLNILDDFLKKKYKSKINGKYNVSISFDKIKELWEKQNGKCYITNMDMTHINNTNRLQTNVSIDQIIAGNGYIENNVGLCCEFINLSKMQMSVEECKQQLLDAGKNINENFYENIDKKNDIPENIKSYLITLFQNKKLVKKIGREYVIDLWKKQGGKCAITGIEMTGIKNQSVKHRHATNISIDKINPNLGYTKENIQLTCLWANTGKLTSTTEEYRNLLLQAYNNLKE